MLHNRGITSLVGDVLSPNRPLKTNSVRGSTYCWVTVYLFCVLACKVIVCHTLCGNSQRLVVSPFPIVWYQSGPKSFRTPNFGHSAHFPIFSHKSGPKMIQNIQFWSFHTFSGIKWFRTPNFGYSALFSHPFPPSWSKMIWNTQFWLFDTFSIFSHQSGSNWFRIPNFGHFTLFPIFFYWSDIK